MSSSRKRHPLYKTWFEMKQRCGNPKKHNFKYYGGRGISYCERWELFANFCADMGPRPDGYTLDRINSDGNYEPSNCRWASRQQQMNNMRSNCLVVVDGKEMTLADAGRLNGVGTQAIWARIRKYGWSIQRAATEPIQVRNSHPRACSNERAFAG